MTVERLEILVPRMFNGGGGKGASAPAPVYTPPPAAPKATEAATQEIATTPEEEAKKTKEAVKQGAKSLQIPVSGAEATTGVGTGV